MKHASIPFIGRQTEREQAVTAARRSAQALIDSGEALHFSGPARIGKTALIDAIVGDLAEIDNAVLIRVPLDCRPWMHDPINRLIGIRNAFAKATSAFEADAFDYALLIYCSRYQSGRRLGDELHRSNVDLSKILEDSFTDALKSGFQSGVDELRKLAQAIGVGATAAGTGAAATISPASLAVAAMQALTVGFVTIGAVGSYAILKHLIAGARAQIRLRGLFQTYPELEHYALAESRGYRGDEAFLAALLSDAITKCHDGMRGYLPCLILDPGDVLMIEDDHDPALAVAQVLGSVFRPVTRKLVVATSRPHLSAWLQGTVRAETSLESSYSAFTLGPLLLADLTNWVYSNGYVGAWPPHEILTDDLDHVLPDRFTAWWTGRNRDDPDIPRIATGK